MVKTWLVRLELARDDDGPLSDDGVGELTQRLTEDLGQPVLSRGDSGNVLVQMTLEATNESAARAAAERMLRVRAQAVWVALGLPPFTITFVDATLKGAS